MIRMGSPFVTSGLSKLLGTVILVINQFGFVGSCFVLTKLYLFLVTAFFFINPTLRYFIFSLNKFSIRLHFLILKPRRWDDN